ncbi:hypothetical protein EIP86_005233, partial [Pleurotus ostreatoroseus]
MVAVISNSQFWDAVIRMKRHLRPLALAANMSQAVHIRPDQILLIFVMLYIRFGEFRDQDEASMRIAMLAAIEARWEKVDQDVFIGAVILNPFHRTRPFKPLQIFTVGGTFTLLERLWKRFFPRQELPISFWREVKDYLSQADDFTQMQSYAKQISHDAESRKEHPDPLQVWAACEHIHLPQRPISKLAHRVLSICANSASCERLFSSFGTILTKLRSRLGNQTLLSLAELKMYIRDEHLRNGDIKQRLKRHLGASPADADANTPAACTGASPTEADIEADANDADEGDILCPPAPTAGEDLMSQLVTGAEQDAADE